MAFTATATAQLSSRQKASTTAREVPSLVAFFVKNGYEYIPVLSIEPFGDPIPDSGADAEGGGCR